MTGLSEVDLIEHGVATLSQSIGIPRANQLFILSPGITMLITHLARQMNFTSKYVFRCLNYYSPEDLDSRVPAYNIIILYCILHSKSYYSGLNLHATVLRRFTRTCTPYIHTYIHNNNPIKLDERLVYINNLVQRTWSLMTPNVLRY